nr:hypothetical protein [Aureimonas mangrovi]
MFARSLIALALLAAPMSVAPAAASSDDAWEAFRSDVEAACLNAVGDEIADKDAVVDPFGSESYGLAIVTGQAVDGERQSVICVYDKSAKTVELGSAMSIDPEEDVESEGSQQEAGASRD